MFDRQPVDLPRVHELGLLRGTAVARAKDPVGQVLGESVRPDIDELAREVRVHGRGADIDVQAHRARDLHLLLEGGGRVQEHVRPARIFMIVCSRATAIPVLKKLIEEEYLVCFNRTCPIFHRAFMTLPKGTHMFVEQFTAYCFWIEWVRKY